MIPESLAVQAQNAGNAIGYASKTYELDLSRKRISGFIDGIDAVRQAIYKILNTERYAYLIYSNRYGTEMERFIGQDFDYIKASVEGEVKDALYQDDRILEVKDFSIAQLGADSCLITFLVESDVGTTTIRQEVSR